MTMNLDQIIPQLRQFIRGQFQVGDNDPDFNEDVHLFDYGYIDSFGAVTLTTWLESTFSIRIEQSDLIAFPLNTITEIATFVMRRRNGEI